MPRDVSVIICTRNRLEHLRGTLGSVGRLVVPEGLRAELVVVDNGSTDGTGALLRDLRLPNMPVRVVREARPGVARARNAALQAVRGEAVLITDDDTRLPPNWLVALADPLLSGTADAVAGTVTLAEHLQRAWMEPFHRALLASTECMDAEHPQDLFGASMGFARHVLGRVPGFDPELGPGTRVGALEDTLFTWQLREAGYRIGRVDYAPVEHHFDERRLLRTSFLEAARRHGRARAFIAYHWQHEPYAVSPKLRSAELTLVLRTAQLAMARTRAVRADVEGISAREFAAVRQVSALRHYLHERRQPPRYSRRGLVRAPSDGWQQPAFA